MSADTITCTVAVLDSNRREKQGPVGCIRVFLTNTTDSHSVHGAFGDVHKTSMGSSILRLSIYHLTACGIKTEAELILYRAGLDCFDEEMMGVTACAAHRHCFGIGWRPSQTTSSVM